MRSFDDNTFSPAIGTLRLFQANPVAKLFYLRKNSFN